MCKNHFIKILRYFIFHCADIFTDTKTTANLAVMCLTRIIQWHPCLPFVTVPVLSSILRGITVSFSQDCH